MGLQATKEPTPLQDSIARVRTALTSLSENERLMADKDMEDLDEQICALERLAKSVSSRVCPTCCPLMLMRSLPQCLRARIILLISDSSSLAMELLMFFPTSASFLSRPPLELPKSALHAIGRSLQLSDYAVSRRSPLIFYHIVRHLGGHILQGAVSGELSRRSIENVIWLLRFGIDHKCVLRAHAHANYFIRPTLLSYRHREDWQDQIRRSTALVTFYCGNGALSDSIPSVRLAKFFQLLDANRHSPALWHPMRAKRDDVLVLFAQLPLRCREMVLAFNSENVSSAFALLYQFPTLASYLVEPWDDVTLSCHPKPMWMKALVDMGRKVCFAQYIERGSRGPLYFNHLTRLFGDTLLLGAVSSSVDMRSISNVIWLLRFRSTVFGNAWRKAELKANMFFRPILEAYRRSEDWQERLRTSTNVLKYYCDEEMIFQDDNPYVKQFFTQKRSSRPIFW